MIKRQLSGITRVLTLPGQGQLIQPALIQSLSAFQAKSGPELPSYLSPLFNGAERSWFHKSSNLQPAVVYTSLLILDLLKSEGVDLNVSYLMGHSLGELTTLVLNDVIPREAATYVAHKRGQFMEDCATDSSKYGMTAFLFKESPDAMSIIQSRVDEFNSLGVANINGIDQCVISGELKELEQLAKLLKRDIKAKGTKLEVQLPFHNDVLTEAKHKFRELVYTELDIDKARELTVPIISNLTGEISHTHGVALENFIDDFTKPVQFSKGLSLAMTNDVTFINVGPNARVIQGLVKRINTGSVVGNFAVESEIDIAQLAELNENE